MALSASIATVRKEEIGDRRYAGIRDDCRLLCILS